MKKIAKLISMLLLLILMLFGLKDYFTKPDKAQLKEVSCVDTKEIISGGCSESSSESNNIGNVLNNNPNNPLIRGIKKLEPNLKTDINGNVYNANDYLEAPIEGKEPKWNFAKVNVLNTKYGESFVTYQQCSGCHGKLGKTSALNKSKLIGLMKAEDLLVKLKGYRDSDLNQYGVGKVMQKEVKGMTDSDFSNLINQIKNLENFK